MTASSFISKAQRAGQALMCSSVVALASFGTAHAADNTWQDVKSAGVLRCGAAVAAPYVMRDAQSGQYSGFFTDLCQDFGEKVLGVKVEFVDTNWDNLVAGIQSGAWHLALALNETPERKRAVAFSVPVTDYQVSFVVNKDNAKFAHAGRSIQDYDQKGVRFVVMSGTVQDKLISKAVKKGIIQRLPGMDDTRLALMSKRADVLVDANDTNILFATVHADWSREVLPEPALGKMPVSFGMRLNRSEADRKVLDDYVTRRREAGDVESLIKAAVTKAIETTAGGQQ